MMRRTLVSCLLALSVGCARSAPEVTHRDMMPRAQLLEHDRAVRAELLVARDLLRRRASSGQVTVDSTYAAPGHAPGFPTSEMRPPSRTQSLRDSLRLEPSAGENILIRLSKPEIDGNRVRITGTIEFPSAAQPGGKGYETVEYTLEDGAPAWKIRTRVQLGIT